MHFQNSLLISNNLIRRMSDGEMMFVVHSRTLGVKVKQKIRISFWDNRVSVSCTNLNLFIFAKSFHEEQKNVRKAIETSYCILSSIIIIIIIIYFILRVFFCCCCCIFYICIHWKISSTNCLVIIRCGRVGSTFGLWYNLALMAYNWGDRSQRTLNHQSHTNTACENWVPLGQRKLAWRPSISQ